jgi:hypothetical protein
LFALGLSKQSIDARSRTRPTAARRPGGPQRPAALNRKHRTTGATRATRNLRPHFVDGHFTVGSTLLEAWASQKSFRRKDTPAAPRDDDPGNPPVAFHGERRSNATHQSTDERQLLYDR